MALLTGTRQAPAQQTLPDADEAIAIVQEHLDREAKNRSKKSLQPRELCPDQKAQLVEDLHRRVFNR